MSHWSHRKVIDHNAPRGHGSLKATLNWWHLVALGVGAIVGTGIYTLVGVGAGLAGPAVILSFVVAGLICACAALAYAEVATMIPASGSAYTYSYVSLGQLIAWVVGWSLILEYSLVCSAVAVGWSGYAVGFLETIGIHLPVALTAGPHAGGVLNLPAMFIVAAVAGLLALGTKESATINAVLVVIKIAALALFLFVALPHFDAANFKPFMPFGFVATAGAGGVQHGVMAAAAIIFFAFYGFDAVSTAAEECKNPGRDLPIGIIGAMLVCTVIYIGVAAAAIGAQPFTSFAKSPEPLALILRSLNSGWAAGLVGAAAIIALPTVILAFLFGQTRIFFAMARDGLFPQALAKVNPRTGTPVRITVVTAIVVAILAGLVPLGEIAALANAGTLVAFIAVAACLMVMRKREPDRKRLFRTPLAFVVGPFAILGCLYLFYSLPRLTQGFFAVWTVLGLAIYFLWASRRLHSQAV
jgi:APA family basic amino acid/polyamine antiporter